MFWSPLLHLLKLHSSKRRSQLGAATLLYAPTSRAGPATTGRSTRRRKSGNPDILNDGSCGGPGLSVVIEAKRPERLIVLFPGFVNMSYRKCDDSYSI